MNIGEKVKQKINEKGIKIHWIAEQIGISRSSFSQRIKGTPEFKHSELVRITKALGLPDDFNWFGND
jgi:predicted XRE-type DNA-binding protein